MRWPWRMGYILPLLALLVAGACQAPAKPPRGSQILLINLEALKHVPEVSYSVADEHFVIRPADDNNDLVVAKLDVRNMWAVRVRMVVNGDAVTLRNKEGPHDEYRAIDPFQRRELIAGSAPEDGQYAPLIWGPVELAEKCFDAGGQTQPCQASGWVVFETPRGAQFNQLRWGTGDTVFLNF